MGENILQFFIRQFVLNIKIDGNEHTLQRRVVLFNGLGRLV